jgi:asparagine N-glycosylation enzyme membrane subunit Stt3
MISVFWTMLFVSVAVMTCLRIDLEKRSARTIRIIYGICAAICIAWLVWFLNHYNIDVKTPEGI